MTKAIHHITLKNKQGEVLTIYKIDGSTDEFAVGIEGGDHFTFAARDADEIKQAIDEVVETA